MARTNGARRRITFAETASYFVKLRQDKVHQLKATPPREVRKCRDYPSLSNYCGAWQDSMWKGDGVYMFAHGVKYIGEMHNSEFHGNGTLIYPNGQKLIGKWQHGKLINWSYSSNEHQDTEEPEPWPYCQFPNRTFYISKERGLRSPDNERLAPTEPPRTVPPNCYDTNQGFYDERLKAVRDPDDGSILRVPTADEVDWILRMCRQPDPIAAVGYRPDLYEYWTNGTKNATKKILESLQHELLGEDNIRFSKRDYNMTDHNESIKQFETFESKLDGF